MQIKDITADYELVTNSQDVKSIDEFLGLNDYDEHSFFVKVGEGEYTEVLMFAGSVPYMDKQVFKIL